MKLKALLLSSLLGLIPVLPAAAADYIIDTKGAHASIGFRFKHLGYSWLTGRFNTFEGTFSYDAARPEASVVKVDIDVTSLDSNHAERDKHLRSKDYLDTDRFPKASFISTKVVRAGDGGLRVHGNLTLHGVTREIVIDVDKVGEGKDPWGGYRAGFEGVVTLNTRDFGISMPPTNQVELFLNVEGVRQ